jgi:flagellar M-ring protein FliF
MLVLLGLGAAGAIAAVTIISSRLEMAPLFATLSPEDAANVVQKLKERKVPFQVEGNAVLVPAERVASLRLELSGEGTLRGGGLGFELFDKRTLGMSDFAQRLNYRRALMGELSRTIASIQQVESARVHLVLPERSVFSSREEPASASVVVRLRNGQDLAPAQVRAVVHLVASSVERMRPENVTVVDQAGRLLWKRRSAGGDDGANADSSADRDRVLERRTRTMLEAVVGAGKARVSVVSELEGKRLEQTVEAFDPESRVLRSEQETRDTMGAGLSAPAQAGGVPGARAATTGASVTAAPTQGASRMSAVKNYELTKTLTRTIDPGGRVRRLSVAVLVDGRYEEKEGKRVYVARAADELRKLEDVVRSAVGYDAQRGDTVTVRSVPFESAVKAEGVESAPPAQSAWIPYAKWGGLGLAVLLFFAFFVRPLMKSLTRVAAPGSFAGSDETAALGEPAAVTAGQRSSAAVALEAPRGEKVEMGEHASPRDAALAVASENPRRAAQVISQWLAQGRATKEATP